MFRFQALLFYMLSVYAVCIRSELEGERMTLMNRYILHQKLPCCNDVRTGVHETCEIYHKNDQVIKQTCAIENQQCLDGSYNQTCMILYMDDDGGEAYKCTCDDQKKPLKTNVEYHWSQWRKLPDSSVGLYREIYDALVTSPQPENTGE